MIFYRHFRARSTAARRDGEQAIKLVEIMHGEAPQHELPRGAPAREEPEINLIPLIDVLLVILIFLMVTTTYRASRSCRSTCRPPKRTSAEERPNQIDVAVDAPGQLLVNKHAVAVRAIADGLRRGAEARRGRHEDPVIVINADADATHQSVINIMEAARIAGYSHITFTTQAPRSEPRA